MKKMVFLAFLFILLTAPSFQAVAQSLSSNNPTTSTFDTSEFPGWAKDLRRFDIIAFGTFPFSMFIVTTIMESMRWYNANGWDMSEEGRRYAPWPAKSAGAYEMSNSEYANTILIAAGLSVAFALVDLLIINIKRSNERKRLESLPSGAYEIEIRPYGEPDDEE